MIDMTEWQRVEAGFASERRPGAIGFATLGSPFSHSIRSRFQSIWVVSVLCLTVSHCLALDPEKSIFQFNCRTWTRQNGLPADGVNAIAQTPDGYLWLGTAEGLVSFDGIDFKSYGLNRSQSRIVNSLCVSRDGGLWVGMERGAFAYCDGQKVTLQGKEAWGGVSLDVHSILETADRSVWLAAESQVARLSKDHLYQTFSTNDATALMEDSKGRVWIGTAHRGLYWWENGFLGQFPDHAVDAQEIRALAEQKNGEMWIGTDRGPLCYDSNFLRKDFPFPWHPVRAILVDREGTMWWGTLGGGLIKYRDGTISAFGKQDGLADDYVTALAEDKEGNLWVGTRNGLSQFSDVKLPTFTKNEGVPGEVIPDICASRKGGLWLATGQGFSWFDGKGNSETMATGVTNEYVNRIFEAKNGDVCLVDAYKAFDIFRGTNLLARHTNEEWPSAICEDAKSVVVAVGGKLFRAGPDFFSPFQYSDGQGPEFGWIFNMVAGRDGCLWLATDAGICRIKDGLFQLWSQKDGLGGRVVWISEDTEGVVWAGMDQGIARLKNGKITTVDHDHGLLDDIIYAIVPDNHRRLWVDSSRGFFSLAARNFDDFAGGRVDHVTCTGFTGVDGVKSAERFQQKEAGCKTLDGRIWFPTAQGLVMIDPDRVKPNAIAPRIYIQNARADGKEIKPGQKKVPPGKGDIEFQYAGLSYIAPERVHYRYMLEGYDKNWVDAGARRSAFYTNLKPGAYRFRVEACNGDGVWSAVPASFDVELLPHYYQTGWFLFIVIAASAGALFALFAWRLKHLTNKQQQLQKARDLLEVKVQERTLELAHANTALQNENLERKQVEKTLRSQEECIRLIIDHAFDAVVTADIDFRIIGWNRAAEKTLGWTHAEIQGSNLLDTIVPAARREKRRRDLERFRATGEWPDLNRLIHTTAMHHDGREVPIELTVTPIRIGDSCIFTLFLRDITERQQAEAALAHERDLLEALLENSEDCIYFKDRESRVLRCSKAVREKSGISATEVIGKTDFDLFAEEHARPAFEDEQQIIRTGRPMIGKVEREVAKDGRETWALTSKMPLRNKEGEIVGTFGISKDVTAIKQAEAALAYERHLLESLLENSADCIYFKDRESRILRCSKSQSRRYAAGTAEMIGKTDFDFFAEEHARPAFEDEQEIIRTGSPMIGKVEREETKDGHETWALTSKMPLRNKDGEIIGTFGISKDITAIKQAEAELERTHKEFVQTSRLAGMAEVATSVLHNVGNVLNSINVAGNLVEERVKQSRVADVRRLAQLLQEHTEDLAAFLTSDPKGQKVPDFLGQLAEKLDSEQAEVLEEINSLRSNVEHVKEIIAMQQSYARVAGVFESIELADLLEDTLRMNAGGFARHDIKLVRDYRVLPPICTDKHKVLQVLVNLVRNAKYACDDSGRHDKQVTLRTTGEEGRVRIAVIDNGVGIPAENLTRIFSHGFTTRKDGHGFGLHSGALAARELGGSLTVYSEGPGLGATFTLELPCQPPDENQTTTTQHRQRDNLVPA